MTRRLTSAEQRAKRERTRNRPKLVALAAFHGAATAFLAFAIAAAMTHPPLDSEPGEYAAALAMLCAMALAAGVTSLLCVWEARA